MIGFKIVVRHDVMKKIAQGIEISEWKLLLKTTNSSKKSNIVSNILFLNGNKV